MNNTGKPLTFTQELALEKYLYIMQELISKPEQQHNPEVMQTLEQVSSEVSEFMTAEELDTLENASLLPPEPTTQETLDLGSVLLPLGWKADLLEVSDFETVLDSKRGYISFSGIIAAREDGDDEEDD